MTTGGFTKNPNTFVVDLKTSKGNLSGDISHVVTTKLAPNSVGAKNLKSIADYKGEDAEVWVFDCGSAEEYI